MLDEEGRWRVEAKASLWITFHSFSEKQHKVIGNNWQLDSPQKAALSLVCPLRRGPVAATHCPWSCWCLTSYINCISSFLSEAGVGVPGKSKRAFFIQEYSLFSGESLHFNQYCVCQCSSASPNPLPPLLSWTLTAFVSSTSACIGSLQNTRRTKVSILSEFVAFIWGMRK